MISLRIGRVWLMNSVNWPIRALFTCEFVKKALKKGKNDIFHIRLRHIGEIHSKKIIVIVDNIDGNPNKICFCELYISVKITRNPSTKLLSKVSIKLGRIYIDLWGPSSNISLEGNCYI